MNQFIVVNGIKREIPVEIDRPFCELMKFIQDQYNSESSLISSIRINGQEITDREEGYLGPIPIKELHSIEIFTSHPREIAEETLQILMPFTEHLEKMSRDAAAFLGDPEFHLKLNRLMEGLKTFSDAIISVKDILKIESLAGINGLELELLSTLRELFKRHEAGEVATEIRDLLETQLPLNLSEWRVKGIPTMIRSRDS